VWQTLQEELGPHGLTIIAVAIDSDVEALREWTDAAPGLIYAVDRDYAVAERYGIVNVPATVWIDEDSRIVRPADTAMGDDRFRAFAHVDSSVHHDHLRKWVIDGKRDLDDASVAELMERPSPELQEARLHRRIAVVLHDRGDVEGARAHLAAAAALAPNDWVIRRGNMPMNDVDPFGNEFFAFVGEWIEAGSPGYRLQTGKEDSDTERREYWNE
jgi:hypothetical protein